jgi:hypothetical protein
MIRAGIASIANHQASRANGDLMSDECQTATPFMTPKKE